MDATQLAALLGAVAGVIGIIISGLTARSAAGREEVRSLRETIKALSEENERLVARIKEIEDSRQERIRELELENELRDSRIAELQCEIGALKIEIHRLKAENNILRGKQAPFVDLET